MLRWLMFGMVTMMYDGQLRVLFPVRDEVGLVLFYFLKPFFG